MAHANGLSFDARLAPQDATRSPYLAFVWIAVALGVLAMFEPSPSDIGIVFLIIVGFFKGNLCWRQKLTLPFILLGLFLVANLISLCYAIDLNQGLSYLGITVFMIASWLFVVGLLGKYGERGLEIVMSAFTIAGVGSSLLSTLCYFGAAPLNEWVLYYDRVKGFFKDPNVFGPYLVIGAAHALHQFLLNGSVSRKFLWLMSCLITSVGVLLCYSRAAWMNYAVTLFLFFGLNWFTNRKTRNSRRSLIYFSLVVVIVGASIAYAMTIPQVNEVLAYRTELQSYDADRFANYRAALQLGLNNPLGVGPVQSFVLLEYATHNVYLRVFSENGIIGFLSFTAFLLITLGRSVLLSQKAISRTQRAVFALIAAALCGTLLNSFTIDTLHWRHFWLLLAIGWMPLWTDSLRGARDTRRRIQPTKRQLEAIG